MKTISKIVILCSLSLLISCIDNEKFEPEQTLDDEQASLVVEVNTLSTEQLAVQNYVTDRPIIAHRGTQEYAPENTAAAYRFARNVGSDYIQIDLQMSKDGYLVGFRNDLKNHANISTLFPGFEGAGEKFKKMES